MLFVSLRLIAILEKLASIMVRQYFNLALIVMGIALCSNQCGNCVHPQVCKLYNRTSDTIYVGGYWAVSLDVLDQWFGKI